MIAWLQEKYEPGRPWRCSIDAGRASGLEELRQKALAIGAVEAIVVDAREEFANDFMLPALAANALYEEKYPLVSALSRPLICKNAGRGGRTRPAPPRSRTAAPPRATTRCASTWASARSTRRWRSWRRRGNGT